jgi:antitoxin VapB
VSLNIKKQRVHELAREAAARTGMSQTSVIEAALEQYLRQTAHPADDERRDRVDAILRDIDARMTPEIRAGLTADDLYDEHGLPA